MPVSLARAAAFDILLRVETTDAYASELLHSSRTEKLSPADHGLATEIVMGVLRWRNVLDEKIAAHINQRSSAAKAANNSGAIPARLEAGPSRNDPLSKKELSKKHPLSKLDIEVTTALRIGAYQLLFLDRIPAHAAINESVELVKKARKRSAAGMVNAVLRRVGKPAENVAVSRGSKVREGIASAMPKNERPIAPLGASPAAAEAANNSEALPARLEAVPSRFKRARPALEAVPSRSEPSSALPNDSRSRQPANSSTLSSRAEHRDSLANHDAQSRDLLLERGGPKERPPSLPVAGNSGPKATATRSPLSSRSLDSRSRFASESASVARDDSVINAHPAWLVQGWDRAYGTAAAHAVCTYDQEAPAIVIRAETKLIEELVTDGVQLNPGRLLEDAYVVTRGDITRTRGFRERRLVIHDEGSQLVALLLGEGKLILDCCAAPGGKTRIVAEQNPQAKVVAMELHPHRAELMRRLVSRSNVNIVCADARNMPFAAQFDRILVDAPCTGTGTLARNPEIKWRLKPEDVSRLQAYQVELLSAAMPKVAPGGRLLYSTCSLEPEENEAVVERVLQESSGFRLLDIRDRLTQLRNQGALICDPDSLVRGSYLRTIPGVHPCDGFFAALLEREL